MNRRPGVRFHSLLVRSSIICHSCRAWPAGATTASVACRYGAGRSVAKGIMKSSRSYMVVAGNT
ncbi:Uncharacterised protein [Mycobacteroides abscessus]|nr:Uncharacterised protein [Mycobacteroides abscessus]CQA12417.1 Uncharacterised protein [Mycobacteroides abscessus]